MDNQKRHVLGGRFCDKAAEKRPVLAKLWAPDRSSAIHIYIYAGELSVCPPFGLQREISLSTLRVISLSTFLGGHVRAIKMFFFEDFWDDFWSKLVFFGFLLFAN